MGTISRSELASLLGITKKRTVAWLADNWQSIDPLPDLLEEGTINSFLQQRATGFATPLTVEQLRQKKVVLVTIDEAHELWAPLGPERRQFADYLRNGTPRLQLLGQGYLVSKQRVLELLRFHCNYFSSETLGQLVGGSLFVKRLNAWGLQRTTMENGKQYYLRAHVIVALNRAGFLFNCGADEWLTIVLKNRRLMFLHEVAALTSYSRGILYNRLNERRIPYLDTAAPRFPAIFLKQLTH